MNHIPLLLSAQCSCNSLAFWPFCIMVMDSSGPVSEMWGALNTWMKMEVDDENQNRSKRQRSTTSNGVKGQGKGKGKKGQAKLQSIKDESTPDSKTVLQTLSKLVLRHEDSLQCLATETDFFVFLSAGPGSILKLMMAKTTEWHQAPQEDRPLPLRILILKVMLEELHTRTLKLQSTDSSDHLIQTLVRLKFLQLGDDQKDPYIFPRMKWDHEKNEIQALPEAQVSLTLALHTLQRMLTLLQNEALIKRFHALRPNHQIQKALGTDSENPALVIPWRVTLALTHNFSNELRGLWHQLANTGLWQLILARMRPANMQRSPLAQHLGRLLETL